MGLEAATWISDLVAANPPGTDKKKQGDDHLRLIKAVLQATFPNATKAFRFPVATSKSADFNVLSTDFNKTFIVTTPNPTTTATLPVLGAGDHGWSCNFLKISASANPFFIAPAAGSVFSSGASFVAKARRSIPMTPVTAYWDGANWYISRAIHGIPVGAVIPHSGPSLPVGFEWANGQTLGSYASNYPEHSQLLAASVMPDYRGRVGMGNDAMGGGAAGIVTVTEFGADPTAINTAGGVKSGVIEQVNLRSTMTFSGAMPDHNHGYDDYRSSPGFNTGASGSTHAYADITGPLSNLATGGYQAVNGVLNVTVASGGSDQPYSKIQPSVVQNYVVVVE